MQYKSMEWREMFFYRERGRMEGGVGIIWTETWISERSIFMQKEQQRQGPKIKIFAHPRKSRKPVGLEHGKRNSESRWDSKWGIDHAWLYGPWFKTSDFIQNVMDSHCGERKGQSLKYNLWFTFFLTEL